MSETRGCDLCAAGGVLSLATLSIHITAVGQGADLVSKTGKTVDVCRQHHRVTVQDLIFEGTWKNLAFPGKED